MKITKGLKNWFFVHFVIDMLFAVALIFFPGLILGLFGFPVENLVFVRLVGAALIGIGMASLFTKKKEAFERLSGQLPSRIKEQRADRVIYNNGSLEMLKKNAIIVLDELKRII